MTGIDDRPLWCRFPSQNHLNRPFLLEQLELRSDRTTSLHSLHLIHPPGDTRGQGDSRSPPQDTRRAPYDGETIKKVTGPLRPPLGDPREGRPRFTGRRAAGPQLGRAPVTVHPSNPIMWTVCHYVHRIPLESLLSLENTSSSSFRAN